MKNVILFMGMYFITLSLFWFETGNIWKGLTFGAISALLKTGWSIVHKFHFSKDLAEA